MADSAPIVACVEKERLLAEFAKAVSDYNRMQSAHVAEVMREGGFSFQDELEKAARLRDEAKRAVMEHQRDHGC